VPEEILALESAVVAQRVRQYELVMIIKPDATEEEVTSTVGRVSKFITDRGGTVSETKSWGLRQLAYQVAKRKEGVYSVTAFSLGAQDALELDKSLKSSEEIIRHLMTKVE
jgi:small subunit ribosomal protein S6